MNRIITLVAVFVLVGMMVVGCGNGYSPTQSAVDEFSEAQALAKPVVSSPLTISAGAVGGTAEAKTAHQANQEIKVLVQVFDEAGNLVKNSQVELWHSVSGRTVRSRVANFTDESGICDLFVLQSGYYIARVIRESDGLVRKWGSIPINANSGLQYLRLTIGGRARVHNVEKEKNEDLLFPPIIAKDFNLVWSKELSGFEAYNITRLHLILHFEDEILPKVPYIRLMYISDSGETMSLKSVKLEEGDKGATVFFLDDFGPDGLPTPVQYNVGAIGAQIGRVYGQLRIYAPTPWVWLPNAQPAGKLANRQLKIKKAEYSASGPMLTLGF